MQLEFTKMQGLGNDFVVLVDLAGKLALSSEQIRFLAHRRHGVGCDQVLIVQQPRTPGAHFRMRIFNADGSEAGQCGNGLRCIAQYLVQQEFTTLREFDIETSGALARVRVMDAERVTVDMGRPRLSPAEVPFLAPARAPAYPLIVADETLTIGAVSMGNPHAVVTVRDVADAPVQSLGAAIQSHERFPQSANVGFMEVVDRAHIKLRVFERGAGETLACGTGACAAVVVGREQGLLGDVVRVDLPGGCLEITWDAGEDASVWMTGPGVWVFSGVMEI